MICTFFPHSVGHLGWMWTKLMVFKLEFCPWVPYSCLSSHRWFLVFLYLQEGGLSSLSSAVLYLVAAISDSFATSWTIARQAPLFMGILQARTLSALPCTRPGDHRDLGIEPRSPTLQVDTLPSELPGKHTTPPPTPCLSLSYFCSNWRIHLHP